MTSGIERSDAVTAGPRRGTAGLVLAVSLAAGLLGLAPGGGAGPDPVRLLAWLALLAPAAGFACGAVGWRPLPYGLVVPGCWAFLLLVADAGSPRDLARPFDGLLVVAGLFGLGLGAGALARRCRASARLPLGGAALLLFAALVLAGAPLQGGLSSGPSWGRDHPRIAALLLDASPLVFVLECAGEDWTHAHPVAYRRSGVEWFPRRPYGGPLVAWGSLLVGCGLGEVLGRRRKRRRRIP